MCVWVEDIWKSLNVPLNFAVNLKVSSESKILMIKIYKGSLKKWRLTIGHHDLNAVVSPIKAPIPNIVEVTEDKGTWEIFCCH